MCCLACWCWCCWWGLWGGDDDDDDGDWGWDGGGWLLLLRRTCWRRSRSRMRWSFDSCFIPELIRCRGLGCLIVSESFLCSEEKAEVQAARFCMYVRASNGRFPKIKSEIIETLEKGVAWLRNGGSITDLFRWSLKIRS